MLDFRWIRNADNNGQIARHSAKVLSEYNVLLQKHSALIEINWGQGPSAGGAILSMHNFGSVWYTITRLSKCLISSAESCPISLQVKTVRSPPVYKLHLNPSWKLCTDLAHFRFWPCLPVLASCELVLVVFSCFCPFYVFFAICPFLACLATCDFFWLSVTIFCHFWLFLCQLLNNYSLFAGEKCLVV